MRQWQSGELDAARALQHFAPVIERLSRWATRAHGLPLDVIDDTRQELVLALLTQGVPNWKPELGQDVSSYFASYAWRVAAHLARHMRREPTYDELYDDTLVAAPDLPWSSGSESGLLAPSPEALLEKERHGVLHTDDLAPIRSAHLAASIDQALAAIDTSAARRPGRPRLSDTRTRLQAVRGGQARARLRPKINQRLRAARTAMGLTRFDMAQALGIPLWRYAKYESGQVAPVPESIYAQVDALESNMAHRRRITEAFADYSMSAIIAFWESLLEQAGIDSGPEGIRSLLGVSQRTMFRWQYDFYKPRENIVVSHHGTIEEIVKAHAPGLRTLPCQENANHQAQPGRAGRADQPISRAGQTRAQDRSAGEAPQS